jgi:hypothetical protein
MLVAWRRNGKSSPERRLRRRDGANRRAGSLKQIGRGEDFAVVVVGRFVIVIEAAPAGDEYPAIGEKQPLRVIFPGSVYRGEGCPI